MWIASSSFVLALKETPVTTKPKPKLFLYAPSFDHATQDPITDAIPPSSRVKVVIVEGNYTLLD